MKKIIEIREQDINSDAPSVDASQFRRREAARAVVTDDAGRVALLHVGLHGYHKLPGGGMDQGEDISTALERELLEEIGCKAEVTTELGETTEYRDQFELVQTSYCFIAKQIGDKQEPNFTDKEISEKFSIVWADNIDSAIATLRQDQPANYEGKFIQKRDLAVLNLARDILKS